MRAHEGVIAFLFSDPTPLKSMDLMVCRLASVTTLPALAYVIDATTQG